MDASFPLYAVVDFIIGEDDAELTISYNGKRFAITVRRDAMGKPGESPSDLQLEFDRYTKGIEDDSVEIEDFEEWIAGPCIPYLEELAPSDFFNATTFKFELKVHDGKLVATQCPDAISSVAHNSIPKISKSEKAVASALANSLPVPCILASKLHIIRGDDDDQEERNTTPHMVRSELNGHRYFFKPAFLKDPFYRELDILVTMRDKGQDKGRDDLRVSKLVGLVSWEDNSVMGLLLEYIDAIGTLDDAMLDNPSRSDRIKWSNQIQETVRELHAWDIVWCDVKPDNVMIDVDGDAWVIDFGGGSSPDWVDTKLEGTKAGDDQGVSRIVEYLESPRKHRKF
jgi:hypothetical protein